MRLALVLAVLLPMVVLADDPPTYNIEAERRAIQEEYFRQAEEVNRAVREGTMSQEEGLRRLQELNRERFEVAKTRTTEYGSSYEALLDDARKIRSEWAESYTQRTGRPDPGWREPANSGTPLTNPHSRGIFGDQDLTFASEADRAAFVEAAQKRGYTVRGRLGDGYVMVDELDIAAHGPTVRPAHPLSPQGRLQTAELVEGHETFATPGSRQLWLPEERSPWTERDTLGQVADNIKKAEHDLRLDPGTLTDWGARERWAQNLSKATGRAMDAAGKSEQQLEAALEAAQRQGAPASEIRAIQEDLAFRRQLAAIKTRMDPRAAGLVPPGASAEETQRILREFQARAVKQFHTAYRTGVEANGKLLAEMDTRIAELRAAGQSAEADALLVERSRIADADAQALKYSATNPKDGGRVMAEVVTGGKLEAVHTPNGLRYRTASGELLTEEEVSAIARRAMRAGEAEVSAAERSLSKAEVAGAVLMFVVLPAIHGTQQELDEATLEGRDPEKLAMVLNSFWEATQVPEIQRSYSRGERVARDEIRKELDRIQEMIARGEQPSAVLSALRTVLLSIGRVTGFSDIVEGGQELAGFLEAVRNELNGPPGDVRELVRARSEKMLAWVSRETGEIEDLKDEIARLTDGANEPMERMRKAELELYSMKSRLGRARQSVLDLQSHCRSALHLQSQFDAEMPELAFDRDAAEAAVADLEAYVDSACAAATRGDDGSTSGDDGASSNAEAADLRQACLDAAAEWEATAASLLDTVTELAKEIDQLTKLRSQSDPRVLLALAPEVLERARSAGEEAAGFLEEAITLADRVRQREKKVRLYLGMLDDASAQQGATRQAKDRLESVSDSVIDLAPEVAGNRVNSTVEDAYASFEQMQRTLGLESLQSEWDAACSSEISSPDTSTLQEEVRQAQEVAQTADGLLGRLQACTTPRWRLSGSLYISRDEDGYERIATAAVGQTVYVRADISASGLEYSRSVQVEMEVVLPDGRRVALHPPEAPVRPLQETGFGTAASFPLDPSYQPGTCRVTGSMRMEGKTIPLSGSTFEITAPDFQVGEVVVSPGEGSDYRGLKYAVGDTVHMRLDVSGTQSNVDAPLTAVWSVTSPDGRTAAPRTTTLEASSSTSSDLVGSLTNILRTGRSTPVGRYGIEVVVGAGELEIARRRGAFELVPLFEDADILITNSKEDLQPVSSFRPGDLLFVLGKMTYNSVDPSRQVHISVDFEGPDPAIQAFDIEDVKVLPHGLAISGVADDVPEQILEGTYPVRMTYDGGAGQRFVLNGSFRITYPVQFEGVWTRDGGRPSNLKNRFSSGDTFEWFMKYRFVDVRPDDEFSSAVWCHAGEVPVPPMSSEPFGPDPARPGLAATSYRGLIPPDLPSMPYQVTGMVWYNGVAYKAPETTFMLGQEPTVTITSPRSGFEVNEKVLEVTGTCADRNLEQARLVTNGETVPIKLKDGRFTAKTVLRPGRNEIRVVAENDGVTSEDSVVGTANIRAAALKIVLSWEAQGPDIDLWVTDPQGKTTNYHNKRPAEGRNLDIDDTNGPGMETYTIEVPLRGRYDVVVHYYAAKGWQGSVPFRLQVTTWEGTYREQHSGTTGAVHVAANDREERGAVAHFSIPLQ